ncbi:hypothetical protein MOE90_20920 [Bacillus spizizenii]|nr:hypothetical protein [Bacillus spizizenii]MCY9125026.1 hypothetical protein [Bacillus spizizenii]
MNITTEKKDLTYIHQYANYLNSLVNDIYKYGEAYDLTKDQANDLIKCLPNYTAYMEREYDGLYTVVTYNGKGNRMKKF